MSTSVQPDLATTTVENSRRIIPIFANLIPTEVAEVRRGRQARRATLFGLAILAVVIGGVYALTVVETVSTQSELDEVSARSGQLTTQTKLPEFVKLTQTQDESRLIEKQLTELMASDLPWAKLLAEVRAKAPRGVGVNTVASALAPKQAATTTQTPTTATVVPIGTITITGTGPSKPVIAGYVDNLAALDGVADPYVTTVSTDSAGKTAKLDFTVRLSITADALGGRFGKTGENAGKTGGN